MNEAFFNDNEYNSWDQAEEKAVAAYELYELGDMELALKHLRDAIIINPDNSAWHFNAGLTLDAMNRFEEAIEEYQAALEITPDDPEILNSLAVDFTRIGQYELALNTFEHIQNMDPGFEPGYCNRIITYTEIDRHDLAEEMFYLAQQINPDCPICFYNIGNSLFSRGSFKRAIWCWERTALLEPTHPQINYRIAQAHWASGNLRLARKHFLEELRNNPGDCDVILDFGMYLLKCDEVDRAREKFERILELDPDSAAALFYLGEVEFRTSNYDKAHDFYKLSLRNNPTFVGPRYRMAQIAFETGDREKARALLQAESRLNVEDANVLLNMGALLIELDEPDYATDCFLRIIDDDPKNHKAFYSLGISLAQRKDYHGAIQFLEHVLHIDENNLKAAKNLAYLYFRSKQYTLTKKMVNRAVQIDPKHGKMPRLKALLMGRKVLNALQSLIQAVPIYKLKMAFAKQKSRFRRAIRANAEASE